MTPITSWRPFRSFVRRDGLFDDFCREFVPLPERDPAGSATEAAGSDDESTSAVSTPLGNEGIHFRRKS